MRREPYTARGISRVPCYRCGEPSAHQWHICADGNVPRGLCISCDYALNELVMEFTQAPGWQAKVRAYREKLGIDDMATNKHGVPKKQWVKWSDKSRAVFNKVYGGLRRNQRLVAHPETKMPDAQWSTIAWNAAWIAADAAQGIGWVGSKIVDVDARTGKQSRPRLMKAA